MALIQDRAVYVAANGINKTLEQAIVDGDIGAGGGGGGGGSTEVFNNFIVLGSSATTLTGINYFRSPASLTISSVVVQLWDKQGVASGTLSVDIKKNSTPDNAGMTTIFSSQPSFNFATDPNFSTSSGTLSTTALASGDWLRLDVTSIPVGWSGRFSVMVYA
jgi:hypothetical protein